MTDKSRKAVPREPDEAMLDAAAACDLASRASGYANEHEALWKAMYDAAPVLATAPAEPPKGLNQPYARLPEYPLVERIVVCALTGSPDPVFDYETKQALYKECGLMLGEVRSYRAQLSTPPSGEVAALIERARLYWDDSVQSTHYENCESYHPRCMIAKLADALARLSAPVPDKPETALMRAAKAVVWFDWSDNDQDAVAAISELRRAVEAVFAAAPVPEPQLYPNLEQPDTRVAAPTPDKETE